LPKEGAGRPGNGVHDQCRAALATADEKRCGVPAGEEVGAYAGVEHDVPAPEWLLPERGLEERDVGLVRRLLVASPGVVDEQVEATPLSAHALEQPHDILLCGVVAANRDDNTASLLSSLGSLVERTFPAGRPRRRARAACTRIDGGASFGEDDRDRPSRTAAGAAHYRNHSRQIDQQSTTRSAGAGLYVRHVAVGIGAFNHESPSHRSIPSEPRRESCRPGVRRRRARPGENENCLTGALETSPVWVGAVQLRKSFGTYLG